MKKHVKVHNKDTEGRIMEHTMHLNYAAAAGPPVDAYHAAPVEDNGNGLSPHNYGDNQLAGQYGGSMGSAAMARWAQDYIGGSIDLQMQGERGHEDDVVGGANDGGGAVASYYHNRGVEDHSQKMDARGFIYVNHNDHVDTVSPTRAMECRDYPNIKAEITPMSQHYPTLSNDEIKHAYESCSG